MNDPIRHHFTAARAAPALCAFALYALASALLTSCAPRVGDRELAQAYAFYINAPRTLDHVLATSNSDNLVSESISNPDGSYIRNTEINQADKTSKITASFKNYHPSDAKTVTMDGDVVMTSLGQVFSLNGTLKFKGILPKALTFKNASLRQIVAEDGTVTFRPVEGSVQADRRTIGVDEFFTEILR